MNNTDTSDEAITQWAEDFGPLLMAKDIAKEMRRRFKAQMEEAEKRAYFDGLHDAFGYMENIFTEENCNVLWNIHSIRKQQQP